MAGLLLKSENKIHENTFSEINIYISGLRSRVYNIIYISDLNTEHIYLCILYIGFVQL